MQTRPRRSLRVMAFLQARMGSSRLPGKVLMPIHGTSILARAVERLQAASVVDGVAVLTTQKPEDDAICTACRKLGVWAYRGPEDDVLARFHEAAETFCPDIVIRATADNPLIDIGSIDRIVEALRVSDLDLCLECDLPYGAATEAMTLRALERTHYRAREARHREHVTLYMKEFPEEFRVSCPSAPKAVRHPEIRVTVDTTGDFRRVTSIIGLLPEAGPCPLEDYLSLIQAGGLERDCKDTARS